MKCTIYWNTNIPEDRRVKGCAALGIPTFMSVNRMADVEIDDSKKDVLDEEGKRLWDEKLSEKIQWISRYGSE